MFNTAVFQLAKDADQWKILPGVTIQPWCGTCAPKPFNAKELPLDHNAPVVDGNSLHCFFLIKKKTVFPNTLLNGNSK